MIAIGCDHAGCEMKKYIIQDREAGNIITKVNTLEG